MMPLRNVLVRPEGCFFWGQDTINPFDIQLCLKLMCSSIVIAELDAGAEESMTISPVLARLIDVVVEQIFDSWFCSFI